MRFFTDGKGIIVDKKTIIMTFYRVLINTCHKPVGYADNFLIVNSYPQTLYFRAMNALSDAHNNVMYRCNSTGYE